MAQIQHSPWALTRFQMTDQTPGNHTALGCNRNIGSDLACDRNMDPAMSFGRTSPWPWITTRPTPQPAPHHLHLSSAASFYTSKAIPLLSLPFLHHNSLVITGPTHLVPKDARWAHGYLPASPGLADSGRPVGDLYPPEPNSINQGMAVFPPVQVLNTHS